MALELRPTCERCDRALPHQSTDAMICSYECTFCGPCAEAMQGVCPSCGGGLERRPARGTGQIADGREVPPADARAVAPSA